MTNINVGCIEGRPSFNSSLKEIMKESFTPGYKLQLEEVKKNLKELKCVEWDEYMNNLNSTLAKITQYAHDNNEIPKNEMIIAGIVKDTNTMIFGRIVMHNAVDPFSFNFSNDVIHNMVKHSSLGTTEGSILTSSEIFAPYACSFSIECKEAVDNIKKICEEEIGQILSSSTEISIDNSVKRGKKGKKLRNWDKKQFWQKGK